MDGTNVNPFIPIPSKRRNIIITIFQTILAIMKFPLFFMSFTLSFIYNMVASMIPIALLKRLVMQLTSKILFKILLFLSGLLSINPQPTPLIDTYSVPQEETKPKSGDIIISNCASYLNLFWLQQQFSPIFVIPCLESDSEVYVFSVYGLLMRILTVQPLRRHQKVPLSIVIQQSKQIKCPIVIFPEAAVTNGEYLINFRDFGKDVDVNDLNFHIYGFLHFGSSFSPNFTFGNSISHLFRMIGRPFSGMKIKMALPQDIPRTESNSIDSAWIAKCRSIMATIMGVKMVDVDGAEFEKYANRRMSKRKKEHKD
ncbi:hypothetical protein TRFO_24536 [Tritrichomonas foetus]|uniref:Phospholipid/glycerol acyltransferase domain-containing protein n=1 Tax=Tritrichomonas foetus TaxID=1144522 RepID=A0A1J4KCD4_9EUKA|nr:hypothetical protein TRFO_24536 [Tritrichomonas foetus]|eukprot:OHT07348.1 hypothetical protein TRFO_24536 [Tritrichomonas foetus]